MTYAAVPALRHAPDLAAVYEPARLLVACDSAAGLYRAIDQFGQVIDVLAAEKRDLAATRRFFARAFEHSPCPTEVNSIHPEPIKINSLAKTQLNRIREWTL
jgi:hypothetical protein